jgi:tetratricopeptide (TPR) repeat protein
VVGLLAGCVVVATQAPAKEAPLERPAWQRLLRGEDHRKAQRLQEQLATLQSAGNFMEALEVAEELASLRRERQGKDHWQAVNAQFEVEAVRRVLRATTEDQDQYAASFQLQRRARSLEQMGHSKEALLLWEEVRTFSRKVLGEDHPLTATAWNNVANNLRVQGRHKEAEEGFLRALEVRRQSLGEEHPYTAQSYNNVAYAQQAQWRYREAEQGFRKALDIKRKVLGEEHLDTAAGHHNLAFNLDGQARYKEAEQGNRKALDIARRWTFVARCSARSTPTPL